MTEENSVRAEQAFVFGGATGQNRRGWMGPFLICLCIHWPPSIYRWPAVPWQCWSPGKPLRPMWEHISGSAGSLHSADTMSNTRTECPRLMCCTNADRHCDNLGNHWKTCTFPQNTKQKPSFSLLLGPRIIRIYSWYKINSLSHCLRF